MAGLNEGRKIKRPTTSMDAPGSYSGICLKSLRTLALLKVVTINFCLTEMKVGYLYDPMATSFKKLMEATGGRLPPTAHVLCHSAFLGWLTSGWST
jgi:hypothetical protein